jgi:hypothetical protein
MTGASRRKSLSPSRHFFTHTRRFWPRSVLLTPNGRFVVSDGFKRKGNAPCVPCAGCGRLLWWSRSSRPGRRDRHEVVS